MMHDVLVILGWFKSGYTAIICSHCASQQEGLFPFNRPTNRIFGTFGCTVANAPRGDANLDRVDGNPKFHFPTNSIADRNNNKKKVTTHLSVRQWCNAGSVNDKR